MSSTIKIAGVAAAASLLAMTGCANLQDRVDDVLGAELETFEFDCDGDRDIRVAFMENGAEARAFSGDDSIDLARVDDGDGDARVYESSDGNVRMVDRGDRIDIEIDDKDDFENCQPEDRDYRGGGAF